MRLWAAGIHCELARLSDDIPGTIPSVGPASVCARSDGPSAVGQPGAGPTPSPAQPNNAGCATASASSANTQRPRPSFFAR